MFNMPSLTPSIQDKKSEEKPSGSTSIPLLTNDEFEKFLLFFNQNKTAYSGDTFHSDDVSRLTDDPWWASCFVKQNKQNIESAAEAAAKTLKWRSERKVAEIQEDTMDKATRETESVFVNGRAMDGTRVLYMIVKKFGGKGQSKSFQDLLVYWLETLQRNETGHEVTFVMQVDGAKVSNLEMSNIRFIMSCLDTYFPAIFKRVIIVDMPWLLNTIWQMVKQWLSDDQKERVHLISRGKMKRLIPKPHKLSALDGENIWKYAAVERAKNKNACMQKKSCKPARPHQMPNHCDPLMLEQATEPHLITTNDETQTFVEKNSVGTNVVAIRKKPCQKRSTHSVTKTWSGTDSLKSKDSSQDSTSRSHHGGSQHHQDSVGSHHSHHDSGGSHHSHHDSGGSHHSHHHHNSVRSQHSHHQNSVRSQGLDRQSTVEAHSASSIRSNGSTHQSNHGSNDNLETKCSNPPYIVLSNTRLPRTTFNPSQIVGKEANQEEKISNYVNIISGSLQRHSHDSGRSEGILKSTSHKSVSKVNSDLDTLDNIYESVFHETPVHEQRGTAKSGTGSQDYLLQAVPSDVESDRSARIENKIYLCPAKVITFKTGITDESGNRYKKDIQIANCTTAGNRQDITYKIKTNAPNRYYVKPSMGIIQPGETQIISLSLDKNKTNDVKKDRFLILFNRCEDIGRNIAPFWKEKEKQGSYYQHRLKVRLSDGSNSHRGTCGTDNNIQLGGPPQSTGVKLKRMLWHITFMIFVSLILYQLVRMTLDYFFVSNMVSFNKPCSTGDLFGRTKLNFFDPNEDCGSSGDIDEEAFQGDAKSNWFDVEEPISKLQFC